MRSDTDSAARRSWDHLLELMYRSALDDARTSEFLGALARATRSSSSTVLVQDPIADTGNMELNSFDDEAYARVYADHAADNVLLEAALPHSRTGAVVVSNDYISDRALVRTRFYDVVCRPYDGHYTMGLCLVVEPHSVAGVVLNRDRKRPFSEPDRRFAERLMPHLQTWFRLRQRIGGLEMHRRDALGAIEALDYGAVIVETSGAVRLANTAACRLIGASGGMLSLGRTLTSGSASVASAIANAVHAVGSQGASGKVLNFDSESGPLQLAVMPLPDVDGDRPRVVVFIQDRSLAQLRALNLLEAKFDLTQAELRVALQILGGRNARQAADRLRVSPETIKSHLRSIYRKTDTASQAAFVARVAGLIVG